MKSWFGLCNCYLWKIYIWTSSSHIFENRNIIFAIFVSLRTPIAIFLLITYLLTASQLSELFKLPILADHFIEHQDENPNLSFIDFIRIHYMQDVGFDDDFDKDTKLPFKSHSSCHCSNITFLQPVAIFELPQRIALPLGQKSTNFGYHFSFSTNFLISIWQPPKFIC